MISPPLRNMRLSRGTAAACLLLAWWGGGFSAIAATVAPVRPNVLFLAIDDLRTALGAYGDPLARTPNLDRLAQRGLIFDRAYCQHALCAPSRASVMTGRRPERFPEISAGAQAAHYREVLPSVVTLPQLFRQRGYHTESIGKVNHVYPPLLDPISWSVPERLAAVVKRDEYLRPENRVGGLIEPMRKGGATESVAAPDNAYVDGQAADAAIEALGRLRDLPFFLAVGTKRPHLPFSAPERYWQMHAREAFALTGPAAEPFSPEQMQQFPWRYEWTPGRGELRGYPDVPSQGYLSVDKLLELRHGYYAAVSYVDAQIGRIIDELDRLNLSERTIVVLWSDHGFHLGENGQWGKKTNTELDLRVPLMVIAPGRTQPGTRTRALVELVDLYPTLAELAGLPRDAGWEGTSFVPILSEPNRPWKKAVFSHSIRNGMHGRAVRTDRHRYIEWTKGAEGERVDMEFYDLEVDPFERRNLASTDAAGVARHAKQLKRGWRGALPDPVATVGAESRGVPPAAAKAALAPMLDLPGMGGDPAAINFNELPILLGEHAFVTHGNLPWGFRNHSYLAYHDGQYWCMWSHGPAQEDRIGQRVAYATSRDGIRWTEGRFLSPEPRGFGPNSPGFGERSPTGFRYIARGFWQREGELLALASLDEAGGFFGPSLQLHAFRWNATASTWDDSGVIADDTINNFPPVRLDNGDWAMVRRSHERNVTLLLGGVRAPSDWATAPLAKYDSGAGFRPEEPLLWTLPGGRAMGFFRDNGHSKRVFRAWSDDHGRNWTVPESTNFPDATSKFFGLRTSRGWYVLISNANPTPLQRNPLCLSLSADGVTFTRMARLPVPTSPEDSLPRQGVRKAVGFQYPHAIEHDGYLWVVYSRNMTTIEVIKLSLDELESFHRTGQGAQR